MSFKSHFRETVLNLIEKQSSDEKQYKIASLDASLT